MSTENQLLGRKIHAAFRHYLDEGGRSEAFSDQLAAIEGIYANWPPDIGPEIIWRPSEDHLENSNPAGFMKELGIGCFAELQQWSANHRADLWQKVITRLGIPFKREPDQILGRGNGVEDPRWLEGAALNITESCFTAPADAVAVICAREGSESIDTVTYEELEILVNRIANGFGHNGFRRGDRIALYMPMTLECVAAYLAVVRAGGVVVSVADSFSAAELARRLEISGAVGVITVDHFTRGTKTIDLYAKVVAAEAPRTVVIPASAKTPPALREADLLWQDLLAESGVYPTEMAGPEELTNILFSSGTTGTPKAIPWNHQTPIKCAADGHFHQDIREGDVVAWPTNIGWMMGPWLIYASLANRAAMALYEGSPTGRGFLDFVDRSGVTMLGVVPSLVRAWRMLEKADDIRLPSIRVFSSTGEPSNREDYLWLMARSGYDAPVIEYCGGTEIGGGYVTGSVVQPASPATFTTPALGLDLLLLDPSGQPVPDGQMGEVFLLPPSIGLSQRLLNRDHHEVYHQDCPTGPEGQALRRHGDQMLRLEGGFFRARGRADDTMNLGGIKVSSLEIEHAAESHPAVLEAAAVAVQTGGEGAERLVLFVVLEPSDEPAAEVSTLVKELNRAIASHLNPLFKVADLVQRPTLPRTASNKLMRRTLRAEYDS